MKRGLREEMHGIMADGNEKYIRERKDAVMTQF